MPEKLPKSKLRKPSPRITQILADNIRDFRRTKKLSQEELADICNLHRTYVGSVERGERNVTLSTLEVIADALHVSIPQLLTERGLENDHKK
jgi:transcriptional regulator with XRE-family HTH domain